MISQAYTHPHLKQTFGKFSMNDHRKWISLSNKHGKGPSLLIIHGILLLPPLFGLFGPPFFLLPLSFSYIIPLSPLIYPPFMLFEALRHFAAGLLIAGSSHLLLSPPLPPSYAAWPPCCLLHLSKAKELKSLQFGDIFISPSHAQDPFTFFSMASIGIDMIPHSLSILGPGLYDALRFLLKIVTGIGEGRLQGLSWQVLPLNRSVEKERLALASFSPCSCSSLSIS